MYPFADLAAVAQALEALIDRDLARRLERRPGHKEERYVQLLDDGAEEPEEALTGAFSEPADAPGPVPAVSASPAASAPELHELLARIEQLEREVAELRARMRHPV